MRSFNVCQADGSPDLLEAMYRLRYEAYTAELGSFAADEFPNGLETDIYDPYSVHIVAMTPYGQIAGTLRLVKDNPHGFVMETVFPIPKWIDRAKAVEHSRGIVRKEFRNAGIYTLLLEYAYEWQRKNGYTVCLGAPNTEKLHTILLARGWHAFGPPREYHNITVVPMYFTLYQ